MCQQTKTHIHERGWRCVCPDVYCMCVSVCGCVWVCVVGAARAALSQICGGLQECWLPLKSPLSALSKYQVQNEGNVASQGPIQLCFIEGSCPCCLCCCGGGMKRAHTYWWGELDSRLELKETSAFSENTQTRLREPGTRDAQWNCGMWTICEASTGEMQDSRFSKFTKIELHWNINIL